MMSVPENRTAVGRHDRINGRDNSHKTPCSIISIYQWIL
jgi:hypothetical protein